MIPSLCPHKVLASRSMQLSTKSHARISGKFAFTRRKYLNRNAASIPSRMFLKTNGRKAPNTGNSSFSFLPVERENLDSKTASIPSWMLMKTNGRKTPNTGGNPFFLFGAPLFLASGARPGSRALLASWPIKESHWRYRNIRSALMNFLRLGYDSLTGAALESRLYGGCCDEEIQSSFSFGGSCFPLVLFPVGYAASRPIYFRKPPRHHR